LLLAGGSSFRNCKIADFGLSAIFEPGKTIKEAGLFEKKD